MSIDLHAHFGCLMVTKSLLPLYEAPLGSRQEEKEKWKSGGFSSWQGFSFLLGKSIPFIGTSSYFSECVKWSLLAATEAGKLSMLAFQPLLWKMAKEKVVYSDCGSQAIYRSPALVEFIFCHLAASLALCPSLVLYLLSSLHPSFFHLPPGL